MQISLKFLACYCFSTSYLIIGWTHFAFIRVHQSRYSSEVQTILKISVVAVCHIRVEKSIFLKELCIVLNLQTVVCFPYLGGVVELGTSELVCHFNLILYHFPPCSSQYGCMLFKKFLYGISRFKRILI